MIMVALPTHEGNNPREQTETELALIQVGQGVQTEDLGVGSIYKLPLPTLPFNPLTGRRRRPAIIPKEGDSNLTKQMMRQIRT